MFDLHESLTGLALAAGMSMSETPASIAMTVPGEPRVVGSYLLNCVRFPVDHDDLPLIEDAVIMPAENQWQEVQLDEECHYVNIHDIHGRWRIDFSFHYVNGCDPKADHYGTIGVAGMVVMETTRLPENQREIAQQAITEAGRLIIEGHRMEGDLDPRWHNVQSTAVH